MMNIQNTVFHEDCSFFDLVQNTSSNQFKKFQDLFKKLKESGPMLATGNFGPETYASEPVPYKSSLSSNIHMWTKGAPRKEGKQEYEVILMGASQELVYYKMHPSTEDKIYVTSFTRFKENANQLKVINIFEHSIQSNQLKCIKPVTNEAAYTSKAFSLRVEKYINGLKINPQALGAVCKKIQESPPDDLKEIAVSNSVNQDQKRRLDEEANSMLKTWSNQAFNPYNGRFKNPNQINNLFKQLKQDANAFLLEMIGVTQVKKCENPQPTCFEYALGIQMQEKTNLSNSGWHRTAWPKKGDVILYVNLKSGMKLSLNSRSQELITHAAKYLGNGMAESKMGGENPYIYQHKIFDMIHSFGDRMCFVTQDKSRALNK